MLDVMAFWERLRVRTPRRLRTSASTGDARRTRSTRLRAADTVDVAHLETFVATRRGLEGYVEPRTAISDVTLLLVAHDGEWTRRRVPSAKWAHTFCNDRRIPSYDAAVVGIPQRMRDYNRRRRAQGL